MDSLWSTFRPGTGWRWPPRLVTSVAGIYIGNRIHLNIAELAFKRLVGMTLLACSVPLLLK